MTSQVVLQAQLREDSSRGKNEARRLRANGRVPAVIYGAKLPSRAVSVDPKQISKILSSESGHNTIFDLELGDEKAKAMIVDWQYEPIKGKLLHIDLKRISLTEKMRVKVPIHLVGEAAGVKQQGGIMDQVIREVEIECLPMDIPSHIDADVSALAFGDVLRVAGLPQSDKIKYITDGAQTVAHVTSVKEEVVATPEAVAAEAGAVPAEPEVIKKGKTEVEGEGETAAAEKPEKAEKKAEKKEKK